MNFSASSEFLKDQKRLTKKWRSIPSDIEAAKKYVLPLYEQLANDVDVSEYRQNFFASKTAAMIHTSDKIEVIKMRLDVADINKRNSVRLVFVAVKESDTITFVELYAKNEKDREDSKRYSIYLTP